MKKTVLLVLLASALGLLSAQTRTGRDRRVRYTEPMYCGGCVAPDCNAQIWDPDLCEWVGDCGIVGSSDWHVVKPQAWTLIPLEDSIGITIPATGRYELTLEFMVGLWGGGPPSGYGLWTDRELMVWHKPAGADPRWITGLQAAANVTSQAYMKGETWLELSAGDQLRFYFLYRTDEPELPVILSHVAARNIKE